jgi:hypothetical protein
LAKAHGEIESSAEFADALRKDRDEYKELAGRMSAQNGTLQCELEECNRDLAAAVADAQAARDALEPREPLTERGIAVNVRYGFIPGEDDRHGPSLRCDVNCDGRWLLARLAGKKLGRFMKTNGLTDVLYLEGREVVLVEDEQLAWRIARLVPEEEVEAKIAAELKAMEAEVETVKLAAAVEWRGYQTWFLPVGTRFTHPSAEGVRTIAAAVPDGFTDTLDVQWSGHGIVTIAPLAIVEGGHPLYEGDRVVFDDEMDNVGITGVVALDRDEDGETWAVRRDDGHQGGGHDGGWLMGDATNIRLVALSPDGQLIEELFPEATPDEDDPEDIAF